MVHPVFLPIRLYADDRPIVSKDELQLDLEILSKDWLMSLIYQNIYNQHTFTYNI